MIRQIQLTGFLVLLFLNFSTAHAQKWNTQIDSIIKLHTLDPMPFSGTVLVSYRGEIVFHDAYGNASVNPNIPNGINSKYFIGSITKMITAVAILQLVQNGKLKLNDNLSQWIPQVKSSENITILHLLTHQSGLLRDSKQDYSHSVSMMDRVLSIQDTLIFEPGSSEKYSNAGFYALTHIIEEISGLKYEEYFNKYIFQVAEMTDSGIRKGKNKIEGLSTGMQIVPDEFGVDAMGIAKYFDSYSLGGGGSVYSTTTDMFKFFISLKSGKLLSDTYLEIFNKEFPIPNDTKPKFYHSPGWEVWNLSDEERVFFVHQFSGKIHGYLSLMRYYDSDDLLIIILCNNNFSERSLLATAIRRVIKEKDYSDLMPKVVNYLDNHNSMQDLEGIYDFPEEKTTVEIKIINKQLTLTSHGDRPIYLYPENESTFSSNLIPLKITFNNGDNESAKKLTWNYRDKMIFELNKIE